MLLFVLASFYRTYSARVNFYDIDLPALFVDSACENGVEGWINFLADVLDNERLSIGDGSLDIS